MLSLYLSEPSFTHTPSPELPLCPSGHELSPVCLPPWMGKGGPVLWGQNLGYHSYWTLTTQLPFSLSFFFNVLATLYSMWDLSFSTKDQTHAFCSRSTVF